MPLCKKVQTTMIPNTVIYMLRSAVVFPLENHSVPVPQDHRYPVTTGTPTRSPKRLAFNEKLTSFLQPIIPVATVRGLNPINNLDDDDDDDDDNVCLQLYVILLCTRACRGGGDTFIRGVGLSRG